MRVFNHFIAGGRDQTVTNYYCRLCSFRIKFHNNIFFDAAAAPLGRLILLTHSLLRHCSVFTLKENFAHAGLAVLSLLFLLLAIPMDLIHGILWLLTFPFWWIHEQI